MMILCHYMMILCHNMMILCYYMMILVIIWWYFVIKWWYFVIIWWYFVIWWYVAITCIWCFGCVTRQRRINDRRNPPLLFFVNFNCIIRIHFNCRFITCNAYNMYFIVYSYYKNRSFMKRILKIPRPQELDSTVSWPRPRFWNS